VDSSEYVTDEGAEAGTRVVDPGTVLFVTRGMSLAKEFRVGVAARRLAFNQDVKAIVSRREVDGRFLAWFLRGKEQYVLDQCDTATHGTKRLPLERIDGMPVPVPPLPEQRRIAAILDEADALRRKRRETLALLDDLLRATFLDMFGDPVANPKRWETVKLGELITDGPTNGLYRPASDYGRGTPIVRIDSFCDGQLTDVRKLKRVEIDADWVARYALEPGQILINRVNSPEHLGKTAIVPRLDEATVFESNMMRLSLDCARVEPEFVVFQMLSPFVRRQIANRRKDAVNQSSINQEDVRSFELRVPPLADQRRWVAIQHAQRDQFTRASESVATMERAFASLLHRAFSGSL
jgi:type I restriction enzyme S subunit